MAIVVIRIPSGSKLGSNFPPIEVIEIGQQGMPGQLIIHNGKLFVYGENGETYIDGGIIQTDAILAGSITAEKLTIGGQTFTHNLTWTSTDEDTASWSSGTIQFADGSTQSIDSGNTGNITATTYIYYNGTSTLQTTTDYTEAISDDKKLLAIVEEGGTGAGCVITPFFSTGTTISGDKIVTGTISSIDERTYFNLNEGRLVVSDADFSRCLLGKDENGF